MSEEYQKLRHGEAAEAIAVLEQEYFGAPVPSSFDLHAALINALERIAQLENDIKHLKEWGR